MKSIRSDPDLQLSVLDVLPVPSGSDPAGALRRAPELAQLADRLGYRRIWYAEHHGMAGIAATSPELLIAHIAPLTEWIRVGAGGVMLPNHVPLQVVERYRALEALHPGRVDLGIGRARGTDPLTAQALRSVPGPQVGNLMAELMAFESGRFPPGHPFARILVAPDGVSLPPIWMLGSSGGSAEMAGRLGAGYAFAAHFSQTPAAPAVRMYRDAFTPSEHFPEARVILAVSVICADTESEARELSSSIEVHFQRISRGETGPLPSPAEAREAGWRPDAPAVGPMADLLVAGTPDRVREEVEARARAAGADEIMVMTLTHDSGARLRSYELLAKAFA